MQLIGFLPSINLYLPLNIHYHSTYFDAFKHALFAMLHAKRWIAEMHQ